ncbi:MAG TPA: mechanosensitive ion channel, partial [Sporosarcina sp.]|nr:mechanosensitive ion channel [Sporosarcina sp.]
MFRDMYFANMLSWLPELILGLVVLLIGFFIAKAVENAVYRRLKKSRVNERLDVKEGKWNVEKIISKVFFFGILLLAFLLFFNIMNASMIATPFMTMYSGIGGAVLGILKAGLILLLAWVLALIVKKVILAVGGKMKLNKYVAKVGGSPDEIDKSKWVETAANIAFYVVLLLFVPAVLHALGLSGISGPFEGMLESFMNFIPKLVGAALIFAVGWVVAKIVRTIVTKLLESVGVDRFSHKLKSSSRGTSISGIIGTIVFVLIMLPVTVSALEVLDLEGISQPAIAMLNDIMTMLPKIAVAIVLVLVGIYLAKWVKRIVVSLLDNLGVNSIFGKIGVRSNASMPTFSQIIGTIVQVVIILLFVVEALQILNLNFMVTLATGIFAYLPMVVAAVVILAIGFWLANLAEKFVGSIMTTQS